MAQQPDPSVRSNQYHLVFSELISAARRRGPVTDQEIAKMLGLPMSGNYMGSQIARVAGQISTDERVAGRPMLTAILVNTTGIPGPGFFNLARELGKLDSSKKEDERAFWEAEKAAVYDEWKIILPK